MLGFTRMMDDYSIWIDKNGEIEHFINRYNETCDECPVVTRKARTLKKERIGEISLLLSLKELDLGKCPNLKVLPKLNDGLKYLHIESAENLEQITNIPESLEHLEILGAKKLSIPNGILERKIKYSKIQNS